ncbi:alpha/beta fold hydrolase [Bibersteinia trehalosi]|uniref:alpha/beta hydrolase n=1 Tax=Bibersteinia trehalosi TaxID=47735 RepID=UPI003D26D806
MKIKSFLLTSLAISVASFSFAKEPLIIAEQGSFAVGGTVKTSEGSYTPVPAEIADKNSASFWDAYGASVKSGGMTLHGDHASVFYQIPDKAKSTPLVFLHGYGGSIRTWQTTPDGREGFDTLFLRKGYPIYLVDQPRSGLAGKSTEKAEMGAVPDEQFWYAQFRIGVYPEMNKGVAFPADKVAQEQFFRSMTPATGAFNVGVITDSMAKLFEKTGGGVFVTHSAGGVIGWTTAMASDKVKGIVAMEPGNFPFPESEVPQALTSKFGDVAPMSVPFEQFKKLTQIPIVIYFGDFIPDELDGTQGGEQWFIRKKLAEQWAETVNKHGGKAEVIHLPKIGIKGNTHFPFSDLNNTEVADEMARWLKANGLDK